MGIIAKNDILQRLVSSHIEEIIANDAAKPDQDELVRRVDKGESVILANPGHKGVVPTIIGRPSAIKVNANIGTSPFLNDMANEIVKLKEAETSGAHAVMDLSTAGDLKSIRRTMLEETRLPLGTVPIYSVAQKYIGSGKSPALMDADELFDEIAMQAEQGVDFMTVHCGVTRRSASLAAAGKRVLGIVSRGGSILAKWMEVNKRENPLYERFDELLEIALRHNVTLSLGDGLRPGAGADAGDPAQWEEVVILGELALKARAAGVQTMIEGPGHVPLNLVQAQIQGIKQLCANAPLYVLGPLTTDCAPGYDHIGAAIGGALAGFFGADFLCYVTPAEHLTLPCVQDVRQGVIASLVAAQSAETALNMPHAVRRNLEMSSARARLDWQAMTELALDDRIIRERRKDFENREECAMCGEFCAVKMLK